MFCSISFALFLSPKFSNVETRVVSSASGADWTVGKSVIYRIKFTKKKKKKKKKKGKKKKRKKKKE